jgi:hypothetical protein
VPQMSDLHLVVFVKVAVDNRALCDFYAIVLFAFPVDFDRIFLFFVCRRIARSGRVT